MILDLDRVFARGQYVRLDAGRGRRIFCLLTPSTRKISRRSGAVDLFNSTRAIQAKFPLSLRSGVVLLFVCLFAITQSSPRSYTHPSNPFLSPCLAQCSRGRSSYSSPHASNSNDRGLLRRDVIWYGLFLAHINTKARTILHSTALGCVLKNRKLPVLNQGWNDQAITCNSM